MKTEKFGKFASFLFQVPTRLVRTSFKDFLIRIRVIEVHFNKKNYQSTNDGSDSSDGRAVA